MTNYSEPNPLAVDLWRVVDFMTREYGEDAASIAAFRADGFLDQGDMEAYDAWRRVVSAIGQWERGKPQFGAKPQ